MSPRSPGARALLVVLAAAGLNGCARRQPWEDLRTPEAFIELLPPRALLEMDGRPLGRGAAAPPVPDRARRYRLSARADGYEPLELEISGEKLAGGPLLLVLRPAGFGSQRRLDADDPTGLAQAASTLQRAGRLDDAILYAQRALSLSEVPLAHKVLGAAYLAKGRKNEAARHYSAYLSLVPDAPDAAEIAAAVAKARGDLTINPPVGD
jgi:tetratricopeptide (TPR) repeat protein